MILEGSLGTPATIRAVVENPALNPDLYHRLWRPKSVAPYSSGLVLGYDQIQDTEQITAEILADPVLRVAGVTHAWQNAYGICFGVNPPPVRVTVTEFHNSILDHYFLSSSTQENAVIDSGGAGPGWARTGEQFNAIAADYCQGSRPVFRFYTYGANTHFFTADTAECGFLRRNDPGWIFEAEAFGAIPPPEGGCPTGATQIWRLYNDRWMFNDSNHRFVARTSLRDQMVSRGWISEGVALCLHDLPS